MNIHVTAVAGTGMGALAGLLKELGHRISGSDTAFYPPMGPALEGWGIELLRGFSAENLTSRSPFGRPPDRVVIGNVCRRDNVEAVAADALGIPKLHIADALREFVLPGTSPLVVAGTHGKTTTSALAAHFLDQAGLEPGFLIGGIPRSLERSFRTAGKRKLDVGAASPLRRARPFVLEGDEYDTAYWEKTAKFLHYPAEVAIVTSIEHDHIDIYPTFDGYFEAFRKFAARLPQSGLLLLYAGDAHARELAGETQAEVAYYALDSDDVGDVPVHWLAAPAQEDASGVGFDLFAGGVWAGRFASPLPGLHNLRNAVGALGAVAQGYGVPIRSLAVPLASFQGVRRRQELRGSPGGVLVYDDFAHHPTAVRETLLALRRKHPSGRLIAVFEPRSATACRRLHQEDYVAAFDTADLVLLAPIGRPDLPEAERLDVARLAADLLGRGKAAVATSGSAEIEAKVRDVAQPGDVVAVLSNGAFDGLHEKLLSSLGSSRSTGPAL